MQQEADREICNVQDRWGSEALFRPRLPGDSIDSWDLKESGGSAECPAPRHSG
jgi:hypothetical protein